MRSTASPIWITRNGTPLLDDADPLSFWLLAVAVEQIDMPMEMTWEPHGVRTRFLGPVTAGVLLDHVQRICAHPDFRALRYSILDFLDATDVVHDEELLQVKAQLVAGQFSNPHILVAVLTTDPAVIKHISRFIGLGVLNRQIQIFSTPDAAAEWIAEQMSFSLH